MVGAAAASSLNSLSVVVVLRRRWAACYRQKLTSPNSRAHHGRSTIVSKMAWAPRSSPSSPRLGLVAGLHRAGDAGCDFAAGRVAPVADLADGAGGVVHDEQGDEHEAEAGAEAGDRLDVLAADEAVPHAPEGGDAEREREVAGVQAEDAVHGQQAALDLVDVRVDEVEVERPVEGEQDALDGVEEAEPEEARDRLQRGEQVVGEVGDPRVDLDVVRVVADRVAVGGRSGGTAVGRALSRGALAARRRSSAQVAERVAGGGGRGLLVAGAGSGGRVGAGRRRRRRSVAGLRVGRRLRRGLVVGWAVSGAAVALPAT